MPILDKDMTLCISLSARPSNIGTRFHNFLYDELGLPFVYKAFAPADLEQAIAGVRGLGIRGCAVSMPFKERVIPLVDTMHESASVIESVNTIVNDDGHLTAFNTDYTAVRRLLERHRVPPDLSVMVRGSGGMAKAVIAAFRDAGFADVTVVARNRETGPRLADSYGFRWRPEVTDATADVIVNVTPLGMGGGADAAALAFPAEAIAAASVVFDVVASPSETPLIQAARALGTPVITGAEVVASRRRSSSCSTPACGPPRIRFAGRRSSPAPRVVSFGPSCTPTRAHRDECRPRNQIQRRSESLGAARAKPESVHPHPAIDRLRLLPAR